MLFFRGFRTNGNTDLLIPFIMESHLKNRELKNMRSIKKIFINGVMIFAILFGLMVSATARPTFEEAKAQAEKGDSLYQAILGDHYTDGKGVRQDYATALYWYQKSANQGNSFGQFRIGMAYFLGKGVRQDYSKALEWFKKSANQNNDSAQGIIGSMYEQGIGVRQNKTIAKEWFGKSCDNGNQNGCDFYRKMNEQGY